MELKEKDSVYIQSFKHDGSLHRTWATGYVIEANARRIVAVTDRALVSEADGRKWVTREPAVCFYYPDRWYNVICMIRKSGVHYYCNIASPSLVDEEAIKNIDYDLDVKILPNGRIIILDEDEFRQHSALMHYGKKLEAVIRQALEDVLNDIALQKSPFRHEEIDQLYHKYLRLLKEDADTGNEEKWKKVKKSVLTLRENVTFCEKVNKC